jgi:hypothetical protein
MPNFFSNRLDPLIGARCWKASIEIQKGFLLERFHNGMVSFNYKYDRFTFFDIQGISDLFGDGHLPLEGHLSFPHLSLPPVKIITIKILHYFFKKSMPIQI